MARARRRRNRRGSAAGVQCTDTAELRATIAWSVLQAAVGPGQRCVLHAPRPENGVCGWRRLAGHSCPRAHGQSGAAPPDPAKHHTPLPPPSPGPRSPTFVLNHWPLSITITITHRRWQYTTYDAPQHAAVRKLQSTGRSTTNVTVHVRLRNELAGARHCPLIFCSPRPAYGTSGSRCPPGGVPGGPGRPAGGSRGRCGPGRPRRSPPRPRTVLRCLGK